MDRGPRDPHFFFAKPGPGNYRHRVDRPKTFRGERKHPTHSRHRFRRRADLYLPLPIGGTAAAGTELNSDVLFLEQLARSTRDLRNTLATITGASSSIVQFCRLPGSGSFGS
jgi:hypothetical protein